MPSCNKISSLKIDIVYDIVKHFCIVRALAICFPMRFQITGRRARIIILFIWLIALTSTIPWCVYIVHHLIIQCPHTLFLCFLLRKVPLFWSSQSDTGISRSPVLSRKMAWRWSLSNRLFHRGECHILLLVSTSAHFHLLHHDLDESLKQIHSNWKQRCSAGTNAATVQGIKVALLDYSK